MKNTKYNNYNKQSHAFFDSINQQQSKFYANNMMPMPHHLQQQQMPSKRNGANMFIGNENMYYGNGIESNNQNGCHYYDHIPQHINPNGTMLTNHNVVNGGRQRYAPYSYQKRSYDQPRFYNYAQSSQQQTKALVSSNLVNISEPNSPADSSFRLVRKPTQIDLK